MAKRRTTSKPASQPDEKPVKLTLQLPAELARRFGVHAEMTGQSKSELFAELVRDGCRRYVVHDHGRDQPESAGPEAAA